MHAWEQIQKTVDYIEDHISEEFNIERLAELAALSPFYYQRLFKRLVKKSVMEYVKLRRMAVAAELLLQDNQRILDVALALGFGSHEQFTRTFKESFGITPDAYRKSPSVFNRMTKPELLLRYTLVDENVPLICDGIVLEICRRSLSEPQLFVGYFEKAPTQLADKLGVESGEDPLYDLWDSFHQMKEYIPALIPGGDELGVACPGGDNGTFRYFAGGQARRAAAPSSAGNLPDLVPAAPDMPLETWELPSGEYIVCTFEAESFEALVMDALHKAQRYLFEMWLPNHGLVTEPFCAERYERHDASATCMELWVRPLSTEQNTRG